MGDEEGSGSAYSVQYLDGDQEGKDGSLSWIMRAGRARVSFANGDEFEGDYNELKQRHGNGTYTYASAAAGEEEDDAENEGKSGGTAVQAQYTGAFRFGKKEGYGKMRYPDGAVYTGGWVSDVREGAGTYYYPNGDIFTGRWKANRKEGRGSYTYANNGSKLAGTWQNDVFVSGKWVQADNTSYHGSFKGQNPTGSGCFYFPSGNVVEGKYESKAIEEEAEEGEALSAPGSWSANARTLSRIVGTSAAELAKVNSRDPQELKEIEEEMKAAELANAPPATPAEGEAVASPAEEEAVAAPNEEEAAADE